MSDSKFLRTVARQSLSGKWGTAVLAGIIASMLGATDGFSMDINLSQETKSVLTPALISTALISLALTIIVGSVVAVGYANFNIKLIDGKYASIGDLFSYFSHFKTVVLTALLKFAKVFLWTLLFIVPGIIASYNYALSDYLLAENPELSPSEALEMSKKIMYGNRLRLFCLELSFIGWAFLCVFTFGIGVLWLNPYQQAAIAAFYRELCENKTEQVEE